MASDERGGERRPGRPMSHIRIAVIGAGPGGIATGVLLRRAGFENFVLLERSAGVGGTWYRNRYPGLCCDIAAPLYSFSFEPNPEWSGPYPPQPELLEYFEHCADKYGLLPHCRFETSVVSARWNEDTARWTLELDPHDLIEADVVVSGVGMFGALCYPEIEGLRSFSGKLPLGELGSRARTRGTQDRRHRKCGERDPVRSGDRRAGRTGPSLPADGQLGAAQGGRAL